VGALSGGPGALLVVGPVGEQTGDYYLDADDVSEFKGRAVFVRGTLVLRDALTTPKAVFRTGDTIPGARVRLGRTLTVARFGNGGPTIHCRRASYSVRDLNAESAEAVFEGEGGVGVVGRWAPPCLSKNTQTTPLGCAVRVPIRTGPANALSAMPMPRNGTADVMGRLIPNASLWQVQQLHDTSVERRIKSRSPFHRRSSGVDEF